MSITDFDADRAREDGRRRRRRGGGRRRRGLHEVGMGDGSREGAVVEDVEFERADEFDSYYGRPVVKAPPWRGPIAIYLFLGGVAAGSSMLAFGAQCTGRPTLR
ncbi:MAG: nitrite reductase, partial [Actinomycetales bacterium]|nr:nitrite reductase [Actinomycetales bacterium]